MIGRPEISRLAVAGGVSEGAQEKDYVLAWLLAARATLGPSSLVFKGGTALRRCYFPGYRYSEDLDFTADDQTDAGYDPGDPRRLVRVGWRSGRDPGRPGRPIADPWRYRLYRVRWAAQGGRWEEHQDRCRH